MQISVASDITVAVMRDEIPWYRFWGFRWSDRAVEVMTPLFAFGFSDWSEDLVTCRFKRGWRFLFLVKRSFTEYGAMAYRFNFERLEWRQGAW